MFTPTFLDLEASSDGTHTVAHTLASSPDDLTYRFHLLLLSDAGSLAVFDTHFFRITNAGHDFLPLTRDSARCQMVKAPAANIVGGSVQMQVRIAEAYALDMLQKSGAKIW